MTPMSIGARIKELRSSDKKTDFAKKLGISPDYVRMLEADEKNPGSSLVELICLKYRVNRKWLLTGKGDKVTDAIPAPSEPLVAHGVSVDWEQLTTEVAVTKKPGGKPEQLVAINIYSFNMIRNPKDRSTRTPLENVWISRERAEKGPIGLKVEGDAMAPTINEGAVVGLQYKETQPMDGKTYVLRTSAGDVLIRRVYLGAEKLLLKADNPRFPGMEINPGAIQIMGRIAWVLQKL